MTERIKVFLFYLLVTSIFFFPAFFGKVDIPTDIRNTVIYPWRYHSVDKKINTINLWKANFPTGKSVLDIDVLPNTASKLDAGIVIDKSLETYLPKLNNSRFYLGFSYKLVYDQDVNFDLYLVNRIDGKRLKLTPSFRPVVIAADETGIKIEWTEVRVVLNRLISNFKSVDDFNLYVLDITITNPDGKNPAKLYLKDLTLECEDYSKIQNAHNYYNKNVINQFVPFAEYFSDSIKRGKLPFWNNYIFAGTEFLSEPQLGYLHPLYFLTYFLLNHFTAHLLVTFISFLLCGFGAFLLARYWNLSFSASLLTGIVYMFHPFNATRCSYEYMPMISAVLPYLILCYEKHLNENNSLNKYFLFSALLMGLLFLSGHLQYVEYTLIFFLLFSVFRIFTSQKQDVKKITSLIGIIFIGFLISSCELIPFLQLYHNSFRTNIPDALLKANSIPLKAFLGLVYPFYKGEPTWAIYGIPNTDPTYIAYRNGFFRNYVYFGFLPFLFSICAFKSIIKNKLTLFFFLTIFFSIIVCTGSPLFLLVKDYIPGFKAIQNYKALLIYSYCVPFLSGIGFRILINYFSKIKTKQFLVTVILLLTTLDLIYCSSFCITWVDKNTYKPLSESGGLQFILNHEKKSKEPFRVLPITFYGTGKDFPENDVCEPDSLLPYKIESLSGYSSFIPKDFYNLFLYIKTKNPDLLYKNELINIFHNFNKIYPITQFDSKIFDLLNVKYFIVQNDVTVKSPKLFKVYEGDCKIYENRNSLPRAFVVTAPKVINSSKEIILELDKQDFNPRNEVILMTYPDGYKIKTTENKELAYEVQWLKYENDLLKVRVKVNQKSFLIIGNDLDENWKLKINNKWAKHYNANLVQRAVYLPKAGDYLVELKYFPKLFLLGIGISCFAVFVLVILVIYIWSRKRENI